MRRRHLLISIIATPLGLLAQTPDAPALVFVLVDTSRTIPNVNDFRSAWATLLDRAIGGDRVVIAVVSGRTGKQENSALTVTGDDVLPEKSWNDNPIVYQESFDAAKALLTKDFEAALAKPRTDRTELLRSIRDAGRILSAERERQKVLIVLSDMLHDSAEYKFDRAQLSEAFTNSVIETAKRAKTLPDLQGVRIYTQVPGVAAPTKAEQVEQFWVTYLSACGAKLDHQTYGTLANYRR